jgi:hypothetical protein
MPDQQNKRITSFSLAVCQCCSYLSGPVVTVTCWLLQSVCQNDRSGLSPVPASFCTIAVDDVFVDVPWSEGVQGLASADSAAHTVH